MLSMLVYSWLIFIVAGDYIQYQVDSDLLTLPSSSVLPEHVLPVWIAQWKPEINNYSWESLDKMHCACEKKKLF